MWEAQGIKISTGAPDIPALKTMDALVGMQGFSVYYHTLPKIKVNDWLVEEHKNVLMVQCQICLQQEECQQQFLL